MLPRPAPLDDVFGIGQHAVARNRVQLSRRTMAENAALAFGGGYMMPQLRAMYRRMYRRAQAENGRARAILARPEVTA